MTSVFEPGTRIHVYVRYIWVKFLRLDFLRGRSAASKDKLEDHKGMACTITHAIQFAVAVWIEGRIFVTREIFGISD